MPTINGKVSDLDVYNEDSKEAVREIKDSIDMLNEAIIKEGGDIYDPSEAVMAMTISIDEVIEIRKVLGKCFNVYAFGESYNEGGS